MSDPRRLRAPVLALLISVAAGACGAFVANIFFPLVELWRMGFEAWPRWPGLAGFVRAGWFTAWVFGLVIAFLTGALVTRRTGGRARAAVIALTACGMVALGWRTLAESYEEHRSQDLPAFTLELVAAYQLQEEVPPGQMRAVVVDASGNPGDVIESDGRRFNVHRGDSVRVTSGEVRRVRWFAGDDGPTISVRLDGDAASRLRERSLKRMSQHDALFLDGALVYVPLYEDVVIDRLWLHSRDEAQQRRLFERLTGAPP